MNQQTASPASVCMGVGSATTGGRCGHVRRLVGHDVALFIGCNYACKKGCKGMNKWCQRCWAKSGMPQVRGNDPDAAKSHMAPFGTGPCSTRSNVRARVCAREYRTILRGSGGCRLLSRALFNILWSTQLTMTQHLNSQRSVSEQPRRARAVASDTFERKQPFIRWF